MREIDPHTFRLENPNGGEKQTLYFQHDLDSDQGTTDEEVLTMMVLRFETLCSFDDTERNRKALNYIQMALLQIVEQRID